MCFDTGNHSSTDSLDRTRSDGEPGGAALNVEITGVDLDTKSTLGAAPCNEQGDADGGVPLWGGQGPRRARVHSSSPTDGIYVAVSAAGDTRGRGDHLYDRLADGSPLRSPLGQLVFIRKKRGAVAGVVRDARTENVGAEVWISAVTASFPEDFPENMAATDRVRRDDSTSRR